MKCTCRVCDANVEPVSPHATSLVTVVMWVCAILLMIASSIPLLGLLFLPLLFLAAWGLGAAASRSSIAVCPVCRSQIARPTVEPATIPGPLVPQPA